MQPCDVKSSTTAGRAIPKRHAILTLPTRPLSPNRGNTRIVAVDGAQVAVPTFPAQGTWDSWVTLSVPVTLTAGLHTVVVWLGSGQTGAINLDNLVLN